jgi:hypothetical protein
MPITQWRSKSEKHAKYGRQPDQKVPPFAFHSIALLSENEKIPVSDSLIQLSGFVLNLECFSARAISRVPPCAPQSRRRRRRRSNCSIDCTGPASTDVSSYTAGPPPSGNARTSSSGRSIPNALIYPANRPVTDCQFYRLSRGSTQQHNHQGFHRKIRAIMFHVKHDRRVFASHYSVR